MNAPDVTVVVAVYNTMPYLTECLGSLVEQTIGLDRLEVVAVDDGSTDTGGAELDRWASEFPGTIKVLHQENSGGPAAPSNRALEIATGRYVFFLGADDHLGAEALERLVRTADELDADVVLGRLVGAGGRVVNQDVYKPGNRDSITLTDSALPWALSNTKLFRRSLIEEHGIRFPEELRSLSDQPFTLRAVVAARRIAVRADYEFYYAVRREDSSNITYGTPVTRFVHDTTVVMDTVADVVADPEARFRVLHRNFSWEVGKLVAARFVAADTEGRRQVQEGVRKLAEAHLTEPMRAELATRHRIPISIAQHGTLDDLSAVAEHIEEHGLAPLVLEGDRLFAALPGFRDPAKSFPDEWFEVTERSGAVRQQTRPGVAAWVEETPGEPALHLEWTSALATLPEGVRVTAGPARAVRVETEPAPFGTTVRAVFRVADLAQGVGVRTKRVRLEHGVSAKLLGSDVAVAEVPGTGSVRYRRGLLFDTVTVKPVGRSRLTVSVNTLGARRLVGLVRRLKRR